MQKVYDGGIETVRKLTIFEIELKNRYNYYSSPSRKRPSNPPTLNSTEAVYNRILDIVLTANGVGDEQELTGNSDLLKKRSSIEAEFHKGWNGKGPDLFEELLCSDQFKDYPLIQSIRQTRAKFTLHNTRSPFGNTFARAIGEVAGAIGYEDVRKRARSIHEVRQNAKKVLRETRHVT